MEIGKIGSPEQAFFDRMFSGEGRFGREVGQIGPDIAPDVAAALYAPRIQNLFADAAFGEFYVTLDGAVIDFMAFNPDGSNVQLGLSVNDALELEVVWAAGVSVHDGNQVDIDWWFEDQEQKFTDVENLKSFIEQFKDW